jgi:hypothetical protein
LAIGRVNPEDRSRTNEFAKAVRRAIGEPSANFFSHRRFMRTDAPGLLIDVSGSMRPLLSGTNGKTFIFSIIANNNVTAVATADRELLAEGAVTSDEIDRIMGVGGNGDTALLAPVETLLQYCGTLLVLTDDEGLSQLSQLNVQSVERIKLDRATLCLALVSVR